jgi:hypothetical protein
MVFILPVRRPFAQKAPKSGRIFKMYLKLLGFGSIIEAIPPTTLIIIQNLYIEKGFLVNFLGK